MSLFFVARRLGTQCSNSTLGLRRSCLALGLASAAWTGCAVDASQSAEDAEEFVDQQTVPPEIRRLSQAFYETESVFAEQGIAVVRSPVGGIFLRAASCEERDQVLDALVALRRQSEPGFRLRAPSLRKSQRPSGWCEAKIDSVLPPYLAQTLGKQIDDNSMQSNCWGHALFLRGLVTGVKEASDDAFTQILQSPLCIEVPSTEPGQPGDIVALRGVSEDNGQFEFSEVHGAIWITERLWSSKNGAGNFSIESSDAIFGEYLQSDIPVCRERTPLNPSPEHLRQCEHLFQLFRCSTPEEFQRAAAPRRFETYQRMHARLRPWLWETIHQQQADEASGSGVVRPGESYISRSKYEPIRMRFDVVPSTLDRTIRQLARDPYLRPEYSFSSIAVPSLPFVYDVEGDGYERITTGYRQAGAELLAMVADPTKMNALSIEEQVLLRNLFAEVQSSQLADPEAVSDEALLSLEPSRVLTR